MGQVQMKRIVVDTKVLVSGLLFGGVPGGVAALWQKGEVRPLCSKEIVEEYLRVLAYPKFRLDESELELILAREILPYFEAIALTLKKPTAVAYPADDKFIWCALDGGATVIVSGDEHLLKLKDSPVPVLSAAEFLSSFRSLG